MANNDVALSTKIKEWIAVLIIVAILATIGNLIGYDIGIVESLPGMIVLVVISLLGLILNYLIPINIPTVIYISLIGMLVAIPWSPISQPIIEWVSKVQLLALATPILAYSGVVVGRDWKDFSKVGFRGLIVALLVVIGTFFVSSGIAEVLSRYVFK